MNDTVSYDQKCLLDINDLILTSIVIKLERYACKKRVSYL